MMKRALTVAAALVALTGCTPRELRMWQSWHSTDPAAAEAFANTPEVQAALHVTPPAVPHAARWDRIAWCESGGQWAHPPVRNRYGVFTGGLMVKSDVWVHYGGTQYAPQAWLATRAQQIDIAERILADVGWRAWQCA